MEKIISFLIVFGVAALFEFLKDRKKKADSSRAATSQPKRSSYRRPYANALSELEGLLDMRIPDSPAGPPHPLPVADERDNTTDCHNGRTFLPGESHHRPVTVPEQEEELMELVSLPELPDASGSDHIETAEDRRLAEHYERWRRAIIDTAILTPRHKSITENNI